MGDMMLGHIRERNDSACIRTVISLCIILLFVNIGYTYSAINPVEIRVDGNPTPSGWRETEASHRAENANWTFRRIDDNGGHGKGTSIAVDSNNLPHVSYYDTINGSIKYGHFDGNEWSIENVKMNIGIYGGVQGTSLALDSNDRPHITYSNYTSGDLMYTHYDGSKWLCETVDSQGVFGCQNSLALDMNDHPHIGYSRGLNWNEFNLTYAYYDGNQWHNETLDFISNYGNISLQLDSNSRPHISYQSATDDDLRYAYFDGNQWQLVTVVSQGVAGFYNSLSLDSNDHPHIGYSDFTNDDLRYAYHDGNQWNIEIVDSDGTEFWTITIRTDSHDCPHIIYRTYPDRDLRYRYFDGGQWKEEMVDSPGWGRSASMTLDTTGRAHICYYHSLGMNEHALKYAVRNDPPSHLNWHRETVDSAGNIGMFTSLEIDSDNNPHVSYYDCSARNLKYAYYDGSKWSNETVDSSGDVGTAGTSLALNSTGGPHIVYFDEPNDDLKYARYDGNQWHIETVDTDTVSGMYSSIAMDSNDRPHISYTAPSDFPYLKYTYWDGTQWNTEIVDTQDYCRYRTSMILDGNNHPHICYLVGPDYDMKYARHDGAQWHIDTVDLKGNWDPSITLNLTGKPHISYIDGDNDALKHAFYDGGQWHTEVVDLNGSFHTNTSIAIDSANRIHIGYYDSGKDDLKYARYDGGKWHIETVDSQGMVGGSTSIALDDVDRPHISYYDQTNRDLKFAVKGPAADMQPPLSSVDPITPYWNNVSPINLTVTASDLANSVRNVSLWYRYSTDNTTFGGWTFFDTYENIPWILREIEKTMTCSFAFSAPNGSGHYEFHSIACDMENNTEAPPVSRDAVCGFDDVPPVADAGLDVEVDQGSTVTFQGSGSSDNIKIVNHTWNLSYGEASHILYGTTPSFVFELPGTYNATLTVSDAVGNLGRDSVTVLVNDADLPVANAGSDVTVNQGDMVTFNGTASYDNLGITNYTWTFSDNGTMTLHGDTPSYRFDNNGTFVITLNVTDAASNWDTDTMTVAVKEKSIEGEKEVADSIPPTPDSGPDRVIDQGTLVTFDAAASFDNHGIASFRWSFYYNNEYIQLSGDTAVFGFHIAGIYYIVLNVSDHAGNWAIDTLILTVLDITPPMAYAGGSIIAHPGEAVELNASESFDNVGIVNYTWLAFHNGNVTVLHGVVTSIIFPRLGTYTVTLVVTDAAKNSASDEVTVTVVENDGGGGDALDSDGDGWNDTYENESGSDPNDPKSTPDDWDGDGVPNERDAYPHDATRWAKKRDSIVPYILLFFVVIFIICLIGITAYTRIKGREILKNGNRKLIMNYISDHPGDHYREINRNLDISRGTLTHHLRKLEEQKLVAVIKEGKFKFYYPGDSKVGLVAPTPGEKQIISIIRDRPEITLTKIAKLSGKKTRTVQHHLSNLDSKGIIRSKRIGGLVKWAPVPEEKENM